jgi:hypothetical protein
MVKQARNTTKFAHGLRCGVEHKARKAHVHLRFLG